MRIRIVQLPTDSCLEKAQLDQFEVGREYEIGTTIACVILSEGWGEPVGMVEAAVEAPYSEMDPLGSKPYRDADAPRNLIREHYPPYLDEVRAAVADIRERRRRPRATPLPKPRRG
jgi:hypothetical protein